MIFVFGSNTSGRHGAGAAKTALNDYGAVYGMGYGHYGNSFAIPTMDKEIRHSLDPKVIEYFVHGFLAYAYSNGQEIFQVTRIGCGLAGLKDHQIAPMFKGASENCQFDIAWKPWLGDEANYWGTF